MEYRILKEENYNISNWTGGKTKQLAIFPEDGNYLERDFVWRLSSATCEEEESSFSKLPDFNRVLVVLEGKVVLAHDGVRVSRLNPLEQDRFDGAYKTKSFGKIKDYNLMVAKGNQGIVDVISLTNESKIPEIEKYPEYSLITQSYYCRDGYAAVSINGENIILEPEQQLVVNYESTEKVEIGVMGEGNVIRCQIFYNYEEGDISATYIPPERPSLLDFRDCFVIANTQFRGAKYVFKKLRNQWYDEALSTAIHKIEHFYLPYIMFLLGIIGITAFGVDKFQTSDWIIWIIIWILTNMVIIGPLMYFVVVPKPVAKHIKNICDLTPYEQKVFERELATNERLERLLKKYKCSGRAVYDEDGNRLDKTF